jgi:hypothetical protein
MRVLLALAAAVVVQAHPEAALRKNNPKLDPNRILCPVLAAMWSNNDLISDDQGSVTLDEFYRALTEATWVDTGFANVQATGIADFNLTYKETQTHRDRCLPLTECWLEKKKNHGVVTNQTQRWLNIFKMNGLQSVEHGFSTGTRGGAGNVPDFDFTGGPCNGTYPCEERFQKFYVDCAEPDTGRFYLKNIHCIACKAQAEGDKTGEFAFNKVQDARQWQEDAALEGWLRGFGRTDGSETYFEMADVRKMVMEGQYPDNWVPRNWTGKVGQATTETLPCEKLPGSKTTYMPHWQNTSCPSWTGQRCYPIIGSCKGGATCISGTCLCGLGSNGVSMCAKDGQCVERENKCTYFGEPCKVVLADNPRAPF